MKLLLRTPFLSDKKPLASSEEGSYGVSTATVSAEVSPTGLPCLPPFHLLSGTSRLAMQLLPQKSCLPSFLREGIFDGVLEPLPPWLTALYDRPDQPLSALSPFIQTLFCEINELLGREDWKEVDRLLRFCDLRRLPDAGKVGLLRITFPARSSLKSWKPALAVVSWWLEAEGKNAASLLRGLSAE